MDGRLLVVVARLTRTFFFGGDDATFSDWDCVWVISVCVFKSIRMGIQRHFQRQKLTRLARRLAILFKAWHHLRVHFNQLVARQARTTSA
jgi:hypothetical protein